MASGCIQSRSFWPRKAHKGVVVFFLQPLEVGFPFRYCVFMLIVGSGQHADVPGDSLQSQPCTTIVSG